MKTYIKNITYATVLTIVLAACSSNDSNTLSESDFSSNPALRANEKQIVTTNLESPGA